MPKRRHQDLKVEFTDRIYMMTRLMEIHGLDLMKREGIGKIPISAVTVMIPLLRSDNVTLGSLAKMLHMIPPTVTVIATSLEKKGLVKRVRSQNDRRTVYLRLTPKGRELAMKMQKVRTRVAVDTCPGLDPECLSRINENLNIALTNLSRISTL